LPPQPIAITTLALFKSLFASRYIALTVGIWISAAENAPAAPVVAGSEVYEEFVAHFES